MLTLAQQQIKALLGDNFNNVRDLSTTRRRYASIMSSDVDFKEYYSAMSIKWNVPLSDIQTVFKSVDIYDKHFVSIEVAA